MAETPDVYMVEWKTEFEASNPGLNVTLTFAGGRVTIVIKNDQGVEMGSGGFPEEARYIHRSVFDKRLAALAQER